MLRVNNPCLGYCAFSFILDFPTLLPRLSASVGHDPLVLPSAVYRLPITVRIIIYLAAKAPSFINCHATLAHLSSLWS